MNENWPQVAAFFVYSTPKALIIDWYYNKGWTLEQMEGILITRDTNLDIKEIVKTMEELDLPRRTG